MFSNILQGLQATSNLALHIENTSFYRKIETFVKFYKKAKDIASNFKSISQISIHPIASKKRTL